MGKERCPRARQARVRSRPGSKERCHISLAHRGRVTLRVNSTANTLTGPGLCDGDMSASATPERHCAPGHLTLNTYTPCLCLDLYNLPVSSLPGYALTANDLAGPTLCDSTMCTAQFVLSASRSLDDSDKLSVSISTSCIHGLLSQFSATRALTSRSAADVEARSNVYLRTRHHCLALLRGHYWLALLLRKRL